METVKDLVELLSLSQRPPIRGTAMEYVLGLTASHESFGLFEHHDLLHAGVSRAKTAGD